MLYPGPWLPSTQLRSTAWVLGETGDKTPVAGLCRLLAHRVELVRARATAAIGKIADPETATALRIASGDMTGTRVRQAGHPDAEHPVPEAFLA